MFSKKVLAFVLYFVIAASVDAENRVIIDEPLRVFLGTLERYATTQNDVVFLLDESGSIGVERFPHVKLFAKLTAQRLSVSADHSRVAVVTFATENITHIDYITQPGENMCTLLRKIDAIGYVGEWTHTDKAMKAAEDILAKSRQNSNKIIVLLTDGQSNDGHSPVAISKQLKEKGIIIFAVGVADVNVDEINAVASSPDHVYILKNFDYITNVNIYLVNDTKDVSMDLLKDTSHCNSISVCTNGVDCCDDNANCYCGTRSGRYECACQAGYYGIGHRGECKKCPRGTYKRVARNSNCDACPEHSTTLKEGSTSFDECLCDNGYERIGNFCIAVKCASLSAPEGGILIPTHCNNTYGTQCSFKCRAGYCPFSCNAHNLQAINSHVSLPTRTCLETRKWSGEEFYCEKVSCPTLQFPFSGSHNCSEGDFTYGSTCHFSCDKGFEISGSETRTCLLNSSWTGGEAHCKQIYCDKLKTNQYLYVKPTACGAKNMPYRTVCQYYCSQGYSMVSQGNDTGGIYKCEADRKWSGSQNKISCQDISPPKITCPKSIEVETNPHKGYAEVSWNLPTATDNVAVSDVRIIEPKGVKPPHLFPIGTTKVVYEARDVSKLSTTCSFNVQVRDKEPPQVVSCPSDIEVYHDKNSAIPVLWVDPVFEDNSKTGLKVSSNRKSGDTFGWGVAFRVFYNASDESGNTAFCSFSVKVKHYACPYFDPPANGVLTCDTWVDGRLCSIFCHDGFEFAAGRKVHSAYYCNQVNVGGKVKGRWAPLLGRNKGFKMPWPDCSRKQDPSALNTTIGLSYSVDYCSEEVLQRMRENFIEVLKPIPGGMFCHKDCLPENVNITCGPAKTRIKRSNDFNAFPRSTFILNNSHRHNRETPRQVLTITFNMEMLPNVTDQSLASKPSDEHDSENAGKRIDLSSNVLMKDLENRISENVKEVYHLTNVPEPETYYDVIVMCSMGQIRVNNICVNCPAGTYKEDVSDSCIECPTASYQDEEKRLSCKPCPVGYTTHEIKSKSKDDCKAPCKPGTYSTTTFEPCFACPLSTFQERAARNDCLKCSSGLYTWRIGSNSSSDCVAPCRPGSYSDTGFEPCSLCEVGYYQENEKQKMCNLCPDRTSTSVKGSKTAKECKEIDICKERQPCHSGSTCMQIDKDYKCICPEGLMGPNCEMNPDDCESSPCLNNGACSDGIGNFSCSCSEGWIGHQCETNIDDCDPNPCQNDGQCSDKLNDYECTCEEGFSGRNCEINFYECHSNPCINNGTCFDMKNGYRCCCTKGFYGQNCENEFNYCDRVTCKNGGICSSTHEGFNCSCPPGFDGEFCEKNIDDCAEFICNNGGICIDGIENATCNCPQKFVGTHCDEDLMPEFSLNFPSPSTSNYVDLKNSRMLYAITVAFFMRTSFKDPNSRATPVSYSYKYNDNVVDNALTLMDTNNFVLYIHGETFHTAYTANSDSSWHHYAVSWEKMDGKWAFYVDGKSVANGSHVGEKKYMHPGIFILGQEQDGLGDSFSSLEAFAGHITEFNVWDYVLTVEEIKRISTSCGFVGNVIPWYLASKSVHGNVIVSTDVDKCKDLGTCMETSCDCFYSNQTAGNICKYDVKECDQETCANGQLCTTYENKSFCNCSPAFEGRHCEYDVDECLENNGGCQYLCINDIGSHHCECPEDMIISDDNKSCKETSFCMIHGNVYPDGETWINNCHDCICDHGNVRCEEKTCDQIVCHPEETMISVPGECCPQCVAWSFCLISPNNMIMTFDMSSYQIEGECSYTAAEDCIGGRFRVQIELPQNLTEGKNIIIYQDCTKILLSSDGGIYVDDHAIELPFRNEEITIGEVNSSITVLTQSDLLVQWNFVDEAVIAVPITSATKLCGLCNKMEEYFAGNVGKYSIPERLTPVRKLSNEFYSLIISDF